MLAMEQGKRLVPLIYVLGDRCSSLVVDEVEGLDSEGFAVLVGQSHADALILSFFDLESIPCLEVIAKEALLRVEENLSLFCHEDGPRNEPYFFLREEWSDLTGSHLILLIVVIDVVMVAVVA